MIILTLTKKKRYRIDVDDVDHVLLELKANKEFESSNLIDSTGTITSFTNKRGVFPRQIN